MFPFYKLNAEGVAKTKYFTTWILEFESEIPYFILQQLPVLVTTEIHSIISKF